MRRVLLSAAIAVVITSSFSFGQRPQAARATAAPAPQAESASLEVTSTTMDGMVFEVRGARLRGEVVQRPEGRFLDLERSAGTTTVVGTPALPVQRTLVDVPYGARNVRVEILSEEWNVVHLPALCDADFVLPVQPPLPKIAGARANAEFHLDRAAYAQNAFAPTATVELAEAGLMRGHRLMGLAVHGVQYNPAAKDLRVLARMTFRVVFDDADWDATARIQKRYRAPGFDSLLAGHVVNHPLTAGWQSRAGTSAAMSVPVGYLIITHDTLLTTMQSFVDWKEHIGYHVTVIPTSVAGSTAAQIKSTIKSAYDTWPVPPQFVLLVGDSNLLPGFTGSQTGSITDLNYTNMDAGNYFPDLAIGRFAVRTTAQLQNVLDKVLYYEQLSTTNEPWIKKAAFLASTDNYTISEGTHNTVISSFLNGAGYTSDKLYTVTYNATPQDVINSLNAGRSLAVYSGHGYETGWADGPPFTQANVNSLTNAFEYPIVCSHSCLTGDFETAECFGETWQRAPGKAGVLFWGASTYSYWDEDDILEVGMFEGGFAAGDYCITSMTNAGLLDVWTAYGGGGLSEYYYQEYNVLGDPSMSLRTEQPLVPTVVHDTALPVGVAMLNVNVTQGGSPVAEALVHIAMGTAVFDSAFTDATGTAAIPVSTTSPGMMDLVVTGHNLVPYETTITIFVPSGPYVVLDGSLIDDAVGGNGDGDADIGEAIALAVCGNNVGSVTAYGVTATLTTTDPEVTITDATETLGDIAAGAIVWSPDDFDFTVAPACADGHLVPFTVTFTDSGSNSWDYALSVLVNAPKVICDTATVSEFGGNGNGMPDPGETVQFGLVLRNDGHHLAEDVSVQLHTSDPYCDITAGSSAFADLLPGASGPNVTTLSAVIDPTCPIAHDVTVNVDLYRGLDLVGTEQVTFTVGKIPILLIDLDPNHNSAPAIEATLSALGVTYEKVLSWPASFERHGALFICLGIYADNHALGQAEATDLEAFLQGGGNAYMEGGDCWYFDSYASVYCDEFGINGVADGSSDASTILGQTGTISEGLSFTYTGDNDWMDQISARPGASLIFRNQAPNYGNGVSRDAGAYRSIGLAFEFGGLADGAGGTKIALMKKMLRFLEVERRKTHTFDRL